MPERFLLQILRNLVTHGILRSTRGVDGGYTLLMDPNEISLLKLIEAIDGPLVSTLPREDGLSPEVLERLQQSLNNISGALREELDSIRLSHFMVGSGSKPASPSPK